MRLLILGVICWGAVIPVTFAAEEKVDAAPAAEEKKWEGFKEVQGDMEKLFAERQFGEAAERCDVYLAQEGLDSEQKQAVLYLKYFAQMRGRDFANASETAQSLRNEGPQTELGKLSESLKQRADAAMAGKKKTKAGEQKPKVPVEAKEENPAAKPKKETAKETSQKEKAKAEGAAEKTEAIAPEKSKEGKVAEMSGKNPKKEVAKNKKGKKAAQAKEAEGKENAEKAPSHEETLQALDASHKALAKAEKAYAKAKADLTAAQATHDEAHQAEVAARELGADNSASEPGPEHQGASKQVGSPPKKTDGEQAKANLQIEGFEKRSVDLRKQAADLRKKAAELRKAEEE